MSRSVHCTRLSLLVTNVLNDSSLLICQVGLGWMVDCEIPWIPTDLQLDFDLNAYATRHPRSKLFVGSALIPISQRQLLTLVEVAA